MDATSSPPDANRPVPGAVPPVLDGAPSVPDASSPVLEQAPPGTDATPSPMDATRPVPGAVPPVPDGTPPVPGAVPPVPDATPLVPEHAPPGPGAAARPEAEHAAVPREPATPADEPQDAIPPQRDPDPSPPTGQVPAGEAAGSAPAGGFGSGRATPLHDPDPYGTPPYGEPGPWAPAPPVQRPAPAEGALVPPHFDGGPGPAHPQTPPAPGAHAPTPHPQAAQTPPVPGPHTQAPHPQPAQTPPVPGPHAQPASGSHAPTSHPQTPQTPHPAPPPGPPQSEYAQGSAQAYPQAGPEPQGAAVHQQAPQPPQPQGPPSPEHPHGAPGAPQAYPASQWLQYDPWSASAAPPQALTYAGEPPRKRRRGGLFVGALVIALVAGGVGGGIGAYVERNDGFGGSSVRLPQTGKAPTDRAPDTVAGIAASALPSVVTFHVSGSSGKGTGTGFVLDNKGHILTNNHVVEPAGKTGVISLTFSSGETARAKLVGKDSGYDLAVVKVTGVSGMKPLPLGNSDNVRVGDPVVAIGAPFDLQNTVTAGIISAKQRPITAGGEKGDGSDVSYVDALQTDAPINPGNSGGPLVDSQARVIGVNSAIRGPDNGGLDSGQAGSIGLGFAIPINQAKRVAEELISTGKATHPVIGVSLDMKFTGDGAKVGAKGADDSPAVTPGGPGAKAGIKSGDVITKIDGQRVHSGEELIVKIRSRRPGERMGLTLERDGRAQDVTLVLGSAGDS
ncbi:trypsin-like peptidase domain-containing protein [Streptomyces sp. NPDC087440]|uniref:S1C family serine protease n=1 Tax=Streptomyces sp. NPDC087440 TaxID=3365790 RepID=UPI00380BEF69